MAFCFFKSEIFMKRTLFSIALAAIASSIFADENRLVIGVEGNKPLSIVDPNDGNKVLWSWDRKGPAHELYLLPNGNFLTQAGGWNRIVEVSLDKKVVSVYDAAARNKMANDPKRIEVHALQPNSDGGMMIAESGRSRIIEVDKDGKLLSQFPLDVTSTSAHSDTRQVRKLKNGHYLVAHENDQCVKEYDANGKVVWHYDIPLFGRKPENGHGPEAWGGRCFSAIRRKNGNTLIGTGNGHSVLEVTPEKEIVWHLKQNDLEGITLAWITNVYELESGNLIIGNCHAGPENPQLIEVTPEKEVVWTFKNFTTFGNSLARSFVIDGEAAKALRAKLSQ